MIQALHYIIGKHLAAISAPPLPFGACPSGLASACRVYFFFPLAVIISPMT